MFGVMKEETIYNDLRDKSVEKWLQDLRSHEEIEVRGGVDVTVEYINDLKKQIKNLENKNALKDRYLKKVKLSK